MTTSYMKSNSRTTGIEVEGQYSLAKILGIWALASVPGALLYWLGLPILDRYTEMSVGYMVLIVLGLPYIWHLILAYLILKNETPDMRWNTIKNRLWLRTTSDPRTGKPKNALWLWVIPAIAAFALTAALPLFQSINDGWARLVPVAVPAQYSFDVLFEDPKALVGNWAFFLVFLLVSVFTMSEEIIFRGILLPKMKGAFGRADWFANGFLFAFYHLDNPWGWPGYIVYSTLTYALPARLFQSTWFSIAVHFSQAFYFQFLILGLVLGLA